MATNSIFSSFYGKRWLSKERAYLSLAQVQDLVLLLEEGGWKEQVSYASLLSSCTRLRALVEGRRVHARLRVAGLDAESFLGSLLVQMYGTCGRPEEAREAFERVRVPTLFSWGALVAAYAYNGRVREAWAAFHEMQGGGSGGGVGMQADKYVLTSLVSMAARARALPLGKLAHSLIDANGFDSDGFAGTALIDMYAKCGCLADASATFWRLGTSADVVSWTALIAAYSLNNLPEHALALFREMMTCSCVRPNKVTLLAALGASTSASSTAATREIHASISALGLMPDTTLLNALLHAYGSCGSLADARATFDAMPSKDAFSWNILISAYARNDHPDEAICLFRQMSLEKHPKPDCFTFTSVISACTANRTVAVVADGKTVHAHLVAIGSNSENALESSLINMYGKSGFLKEARDIFDRLTHPDSVSWCTMLSVYAQSGHARDAFDLIRLMAAQGVKPNKIAFLVILDVCASMACVPKGRVVHAHIIAGGFWADVVVGNALVSMYGRCGSLKYARAAFDGMRLRNLITWNAMLAAYAQNGRGEDALELFCRMSSECVKPNAVTYLSVLNACSHSGMLDEGRRFFAYFEEEHGLVPTVEHYGCMVDLLGRVGRLAEAEHFIARMPIPPDAVLWLTLLGACRSHGDIERGIRAAEHAIKLDPNNAAPYILLSNMHARAGNWDAVAMVRKGMESAGAKKEPGCSWIVVKDKVHEFTSGKTSHPLAEGIYTELHRLGKLMKEAGYAADTDLVLHDVEEEEKEHLLHYHSERLAVALGLIASPQGAPIHIVKNLRVCSDCHSAFKYISAIVQREIILRDANRFHHFEQGNCSCRDYW